MAESKKGSAKKADQIQRLKDELGPEGIAEAEKLANSIPKVVQLAFKLIPRAWNKPAGLSKAQRVAFFQLLKMNAKTANDWRNERLVERKLDPKVVGPEPAQTDEEIAKAAAK